MTQRPIKFRAWDVESKKIRIVTEINFFDEYIECDELPRGSYTRLPLEGTPLLQFTGLLDKNGVEIYEGDVVGSKDGTRWLIEPIGSEDKDGGTYGLVASAWGDPGRRYFIDKSLLKCEVIGNIYESPDLLAPITN